jgi:hypothetical protein
MNEINRLYKKTPDVLKLVIFAGLGFLAYKQGAKIYKNYKIKKKIQEQEASIVPTVIVDTTTGQQVAININISALANQIYDALYNNDWFGASEDEAAALAAVKQVPKGLIQALKEQYAKDYSKDLQADLIKYLSADDFSQIANLFA